MANLGFGRRIRRESGTAPRQSNHRNQGGIAPPVWGGLTSGTGDASFRRGGGDRTRTTSCRATRLDQKSPRGDRAGPGRTCCGGGGSYARGRGRHGAEAIKARGLVAGRCGERMGSPAGRRGARGFWLSLGGGMGSTRGAGEEAGVEAGAQLNRRVSPAPGKKPCLTSSPAPWSFWRMGLDFFLLPKKFYKIF
jgi:hypothetical protein